MIFIRLYTAIDPRGVAKNKQIESMDPFTRTRKGLINQGAGKHFFILAIGSSLFHRFNPNPTLHCVFSFSKQAIAVESANRIDQTATNDLFIDQQPGHKTGMMLNTAEANGYGTDARIRNLKNVGLATNGFESVDLGIMSYSEARALLLYLGIIEDRWERMRLHLYMRIDALELSLFDWDFRGYSRFQYDLADALDALWRKTKEALARAMARHVRRGGVFAPDSA